MKVVNRYRGIRRLSRDSRTGPTRVLPEYWESGHRPNNYAGTTRGFIEILSTTAARDQAKILRGVIDRIQRGPQPGSARLRRIGGVINRLSRAALPGHPRTPVMWCCRAADATAIRQWGRARDGSTLRARPRARLCEARVSKRSRNTNEPCAQAARRVTLPWLPAGPRAGTSQSARAIATVHRSLNPLRNNASVAHERGASMNPSALGIKAARTVFAFLDGPRRTS